MLPFSQYIRSFGLTVPDSSPAAKVNIFAVDPGSKRSVMLRMRRMPVSLKR
jgi:hypothetical protein